MMLDMKVRALKYAARGFLVLPMHPVQEGRCRCFKGKACDRPAKHPMTPHGVNDATTDRNRINTWWTENPNANIGIATGSEAEILVLDIDPRNKGKETLARPHKELGPLPDTVTALTGGGEFTENFALRRRGAVCPNIPLPAEQETHDASEKE